jgi:hypothetical protein
MDRFHEGTNDGRDGLAIRLEDAKADGCADGIFMARWIAAAVKIEADRRCFFLEGEAGFGLAEHDQGNGAVDARAAAALQAGERMKMIWGSG